MSPSVRFLANTAFLYSVLVARVMASNPSEFFPAVTYDVSGAPGAAAVADFNGDHISDVATASPCSDLTCQASGSVNVLLGNGDGTFQAAATYDGGPYPTSLAVGDFNGDGIIDLAVANGIAVGTVSVLLGIGDGTFGAPIPYPVGVGGSISVATADLNGDGRMDLAVVTGAGGFALGSVAVLMGNGDGSFQSAQVYGVGTGPTYLAVGDLNGDHTPDIVVPDNASGLGTDVSVLLNNGDGTFQRALSTQAGESPMDVVIGDLNGDGKADLVVANYTAPGTVSVLLGSGDGTFASPVSYITTGITPYAIVEADLNGDDTLDVATGNYDIVSPGVSVFLGAGDGTLYPASNYQTPESPLAIAAGDLNTDGQVDLVEANQVTSGVSVLLNAGSFPGAKLSATRIDFGSQKVGTSSSPQKVTLTNNGFRTLTISQITVTGDFIATPTCTHRVEIAASCPVRVEFRPKTTGPRAGTATITDNAKRRRQVIQLRGIGTPLGL